MSATRRLPSFLLVRLTTTMPSIEWFTKYTNPFTGLFSHAKTMDASASASSSSSTINPTESQQDVPTLSFDLQAPTGSSAGWTVKNVWGADGENSNDFARQLQDILNRTETYSILNTLFYRHIVAVLVVVWSVALWRKARSVGVRFGWRDALAVVVCLGSVLWRDMVLAIGVTAGYAAWAVLADRPWNGKGGLPGFEAFVASLKPAEGGNEDAQGSEEQASKTETHAATPSTQPEPAAAAEAALLTRIEANLGLPEKKPLEDCVVCWSTSSEDPPLKLPCSHLVCSDCLTRLKEANRYTCPFCRTPLYTLATNKATLFQLVTFSSGAQLALALLLTTLRISRGRYWGAAESLIFKGYPAAATLWSQWRIRRQGEEGYFASTSEGACRCTWRFRGTFCTLLMGGWIRWGGRLLLMGGWLGGRWMRGSF